MGATGWSYYVPYQENIQKALEELQSEVLESGDFVLLNTREGMIKQWEQLLKKLEGTGIPEEMIKAEAEEINNRINSLKALPEPTNMKERIYEIYEINGEEGTHSILDMAEIGQEPDFMRVAPLKESELILLFNTLTPDRELVEERIDRLMDFRSRWMGTYVILYEDGEPTELLFVGFSGD
jgi:hypothetical protein